MEPKFSVIIPVYNAEATISRCLDSLLLQAYINFELIIVDDGSSDRSYEICKEYAEKYNNIVLIHQENSGVSSARNVGLHIAKGTYITFVDSDDFVESEYFCTIESSLNEWDADLLLFGADDKKMQCMTTRIDNPILLALTVYELEQKKLLASPWTKVYKRSLIEKYDLHFCPDLKIGEDVVFVFSYIMNIKTFSSISVPLYKVTTDNMHSLSRKRRDYLCEQAILLRRLMLQDLKNSGHPKHIFYLYYRMFSWAFYHSAYSVIKELYKYDFDPVNRKNKIKEICNVFNAENIVPIGIKTILLAVPIKLRMINFIDHAFIAVLKRRKR